MLLDSLHGKQNPQIKCRAWDVQIFPQRLSQGEKWVQRSGSTFPELNVCIPRLGSGTELSVGQECPQKATTAPPECGDGGMGQELSEQ